MNESPIVVLDIGSAKTVCLVGEVIGDQIKLLGVGESICAGKRRSAITDMTKVVESVRTAVDQAERTSGLKITGAYVGISGEGVKTEQHRSTVAIVGDSEPIDEADVTRALTASEQESSTNTHNIMHRIKQNYAVDGESVENPLWLHGNRLTVETLTISVADFASTTIERACESSDLSIAGFIYEPLAAAEATLTRDERSMGVGLLDLGAGSCNLALFAGPIRQIAQIPLGATDLTNDLSKVLNISLREAERLKRECGILPIAEDADQIIEFKMTADRNSSVTKQQISDILEARQREIFEHVGKSLSSTHFGHRLPAGLVITGGGAMLENIVDLAEEVLDIPVRIASHQDVVGPKITKDPTYTIALGMLKYANSEPDELDRDDITVQSRGKGIFDKLGRMLNMF